MWNRQEDLSQSPVPSEGVGSAVLRGSTVFDTPNEWLTVQQTAEFLGKGPNTVANWCKTGKIAAIPMEYGCKVSYRIPSQAVIAMRESLKSKESMSIYRKTIKATVVHTHRELIDTFLKFCEQGLHNESGNPYSPETLKIHRHYLTTFLDKHEQCAFHTIRAELLELPKEQFGKRQKILRVLSAFAVWLVQEEMMEVSELEKIRKIKVKRHVPPKQVALRDDQIDTLIDACRNSYERLIVIGLSETGLRNSEFRTLTMEKLDLKNREIKTIGKGNRERWVGLTKKATEAFEAYIAEYGPFNDSESLFKNRDRNLIIRYGLRDRLQRVGDRIGIEVHPHAMRRSFVTNNVAKGRNMVDLQLASGHSQISTTRMYCRTEQVDVVKRMKDWD
jgi:integrase/recombinase XerD